MTVPSPRCSFRVRTPDPSTPGKYLYDHLSVSGPAGDPYLHTPHPPATGDFIFLWNSQTKTGGYFAVLLRTWMHSSYGSVDWPYGQPAPRVGPLLDIVVEPTDVLDDESVRSHDEPNAEAR